MLDSGPYLYEDGTSQSVSVCSSVPATASCARYVPYGASSPDVRYTPQSLLGTFSSPSEEPEVVSYGVKPVVSRSVTSSTTPDIDSELTLPGRSVVPEVRGSQSLSSGMGWISTTYPSSTHNSSSSGCGDTDRDREGKRVQGSFRGDVGKHFSLV